MTTETITTATAKTLVKRWAESQRLLNEPVRHHVDNIYAQLEALAEVKLSTEETEQLYVWVRAFPPAAKSWGDWKVSLPVARHLATALGIGKREARTLLKAAGWDDVT